jgi:hypothetical protein
MTFAPSGGACSGPVVIAKRGKDSSLSAGASRTLVLGVATHYAPTLVHHQFIQGVLQRLFPPKLSRC